MRPVYISRRRSVMPEKLNASLDDFNVSSKETALHFENKIMPDLQVFTHRSFNLTKSLKRLEGNSLILLLRSHLLEKEENMGRKYFTIATKFTPFKRLSL